MKTVLVAYPCRTAETPSMTPPKDMREPREFPMCPTNQHRRFALQLSCFLLFFAVTAGGAVAGSISGTARDASGSVIPNAGVTVREVDTGLIYRTQTDGNGYYV